MPGTLSPLSPQAQIRQEKTSVASVASNIDLPGPDALKAELRHLTQTFHAPYTLLSISTDNQWHYSYTYANSSELLFIIKTVIHTCVQQKFQLYRYNGHFALLIYNALNSYICDDLICSMQDQFLKILSTNNFFFYKIHVKKILSSEIKKNLNIQPSITNKTKISNTSTQHKNHKHLVSYKQFISAIKNNELQCYYQLQWDRNTEKPMGMETLIRWQHKIYGLLHPLEFLHCFEHRHIDHTFSRWILYHGLSARKKISRFVPASFRVSINMTPRNFCHPYFVEDVEQALQSTGTYASQLDLELIERGRFPNNTQALSNMNALNDMGVCLSLDDFGTGLNTLDRINRYPFKTIKIDQKLINFIGKNNLAEERLNITLGTIKSSSVKIIAEGIENFEQLSWLYNKNIDIFQGFLLHEPSPLEHMLDYLSYLR